MLYKRIDPALTVDCALCANKLLWYCNRQISPETSNYTVSDPTYRSPMLQVLAARQYMKMIFRVSMDTTYPLVLRRVEAFRQQHSRRLLFVDVTEGWIVK